MDHFVREFDANESIFVLIQRLCSESSSEIQMISSIRNRMRNRPFLVFYYRVALIRNYVHW